MGFFKRFAFKVKDEDSVVCTAEEVEELVEDRKKRKKKEDDDVAGFAGGSREHPSN